MDRPPPSTVAPVERVGDDARTDLLSAAATELDAHGSSGVRLRAVARRAGLSHAAPQHFFGSRAGLLTALATAGFDALARELGTVSPDRPEGVLAALGARYLDFALTHPALFELMFRPGELQVDDPELRRSQNAAIGMLASATSALDSGPEFPPQTLTMLSWALAHGVVALSRTGALAVPGDGDHSPDDLAHHLIESFAALIARVVAGRVV